MYKLKIRKEKGITLIALVITIIILLILAGVSIAMLTGQNGLLLQAKEAKTLTNKAGAKESLQVEVIGSYGTDGNINIERLCENLKNVSNLKYNKDILSDSNKITSLPADVEINGDVYEIKKDGSIISVVNTIEPGEIITSEKGNTAYTNNGTAIIPVGFSIVPGLNDISEGLVISDVANDIDDIGNQFVWIPVEKAADYNTDITNNDISYLPNGIIVGEPTEENTIEELTFEREKKLVTEDMKKKYGVGGFYISRYEAGDESASEIRNDNSGTTGKLVSKKNVYVYSNIKQTDAKEKAKTFKNDEYVKSALASEVQWDMTMAFISSKKRLDGTNQEFDVNTSSKSRHTGSKATSGQNLADKVCNIYDLEGNYYEYVATRKLSSNNILVAYRGGRYGAVFPASFHYDYDDRVNGDISFRFVLYVM